MVAGLPKKRVIQMKHQRPLSARLYPNIPFKKTIGDCSLKRLAKENIFVGIFYFRVL